MSAEAGPSSQRVTLVITYEISPSSPAPTIPASPTPASPTLASPTPVSATPTPAPAPAPEPGNYLASMAEQPPAKPTAAFARLFKMERVREVVMREGKLPNYNRSANHEAILAQSRGEEINEEDCCKKCKDGAGPFATCVIVEGEFSNACANCHYNSLGTSCSFRACKCFNTFANDCNFAG